MLEITLLFSYYIYFVCGSLFILFVFVYANQLLI